jgi:membrane fusion protein (multidrug efflux system)
MADDKIEKPIKKSGISKPLIIIVLLVAAIGLGIFFYFFNNTGTVYTDDAYIAADRVDLSSEILARMDTLLVNDGDTVRVNQLIAILSDSTVRAQKEEAITQKKLAQQSLSVNRINLKQAQQNYDRAVIQYKNSVIPEATFQNYQNAFELAKSQLQVAETNIKSIDAQINVLETQLSKTRVYSPMEGIVAKRWALPGDVLQPGQSIISIYSLQNIWVLGNFAETNINNMKVGQPATITVDAYPNTIFKGKVIEIGGSTASEFSLIPPNNASGNFTKVTQRVPIKISIDPVDGKSLKAGLSAEVTVKVN